jgi:transposase InsO family protein
MLLNEGSNERDHKKELVEIRYSYPADPDPKKYMRQTTKQWGRLRNQARIHRSSFAP